jgi:hypothetical protein
MNRLGMRISPASGAVARGNIGSVGLMTETAFPTPQPLKRAAIIGTAPSWKQCPWHDQTLEIWTLNDGYVLGVPRISRHYDIHPTYQMQFRPNSQRVIGSSQAHEVQIGTYLRPADHLAWLKSRPFPVFLNQTTPEYTHGITFPLQAVLDFYQPHWPWRLTRAGNVVPGGDYEVSTPSWMLMHAILEGYGEIHVYGIHLATEWEYLQQRPNFEWLLGFAAGRGIKIVLPESAPICRAHYRYGFEPKADIPAQQQQRRIQVVKAEGLTLRQELGTLKPWRLARKGEIETRLETLHVELLDAKQELARVNGGL